MNIEDKEQLIKLIKDNSDRVSFVNLTRDLFYENKRKKLLINNEYGLLGSLLDKFKYDLDIDIVKEIFIHDIIYYYGFYDYCERYMEVNLNRALLYFLDEKKVVIDAGELTEKLIKDERILKFLKDKIYHISLNKIDGTLLRSFFSNKSELLSAIKDWAKYLDFAPDEFKNDKEVVLTAMKSNPKKFSWASKELKKDRNFVLEALGQGINFFEYIPKSLKNDKEIVIAAVKSYGGYLEHVSDEMKNDKDVVLEAVKNNGNALIYSSKELKNDKEVVMAAVKNDGYALRFASKELQKDEELMELSKKTRR